MHCASPPQRSSQLWLTYIILPPYAYMVTHHASCKQEPLLWIDTRRNAHAGSTQTPAEALARWPGGWSGCGGGVGVADAQRQMEPVKLMCTIPQLHVQQFERQRVSAPWKLQSSLPDPTLFFVPKYGCCVCVVVHTHTHTPDKNALNTAVALSKYIARRTWTSQTESLSPIQLNTPHLACSRLASTFRVYTWFFANTICVFFPVYAFLKLDDERNQGKAGCARCACCTHSQQQQHQHQKQR